MEQCIFDEFIHFVLQTVSSETYLDDIGIYRSQMLYKNIFKKKLKKQILIPGVYPISYGGINLVHYFGVDRRNGKLIAANGYSSKEGLPSNLAVGMDTQPNHSHGLCQTFALMYHLKKEQLLKKGPDNYFTNILIGLNFLLNFIKENEERERLWSMKDIKNNMEKFCTNHDKERDSTIRLCRTSYGRKQVALSLIIKNILLNKRYRNNLETWFDN